MKFNTMRYNIYKYNTMTHQVEEGLIRQGRVCPQLHFELDVIYVWYGMVWYYIRPHINSYFNVRQDIE